MRLFDTKVQYIKYQVLKEVTKMAIEDRLIDVYLEIPKKIIPGPKASFRCCIFKERAVLTERIKLAMGGNLNQKSFVEVIDIACDECPVGGYEVTHACRGCIAHRCSEVCKKDAIYFDENHRAKIDKTKCVECGACEKVCPYSAIMNYKRPCEKACKTQAIYMDELHRAKIDYQKCIDCGSCVYQCPFGAISDSSMILDVVNMLKEKKQRIFALVAPSIAGQFKYASLHQIVTGIKKMGFDDVIEAALGADYAALAESKELSEKNFLMSSCCPAFVTYVQKFYPSLKSSISHNLSPMLIMADYLKRIEPQCKVVFIGPCVAKKKEFKSYDGLYNVDAVLTFEELQAFIDGFDIDLNALEDTPLNNASYYGRIFARTGGLTDAMRQAFLEQKIEFDFKPVVCSGISEVKPQLIKASKGVLQENFIEGMACEGGCIGGPCCLTHGPKELSQVDKYGKEAYEKTLLESTRIITFSQQK